MGSGRNIFVPLRDLGRPTNPSCRRVHNRDINAVKNMYSIVKYMRDRDNKEHPEAFKRIASSKKKNHDGADQENGNPQVARVIESKRRRLHKTSVLYQTSA